MHTLNTQVPNQIAATEQELLATIAKQTEVNERVQALQARITQLETERQEIIAQRAKAGTAGAPDDKLGGRLALIMADVEGLRSLLAEAQAEAAKHDPQPVRNRLSVLKQQWETTIAQSEFNALKARAVEAEVLLLRLIAAIAEAGTKLGRRHLSLNWRPGVDLQNLILHGAPPRGEPRVFQG